MKLKKLIPYIFIFALMMSSCDSLFEPTKDNIYDDSRIYNDPAFAEGLLLNAYSALPSSYNFIERATDDAVSNDESNIYSRVATGEWSSQYNPISSWSRSYELLYYLNLFLHMAPDIEFSWENEERDELFRQRFTGEAHALRAWYNFLLLQNHGGISVNGNALGFIIIDENTSSSKSNEELLSLPRDSYEDCVYFILDDIEAAISLLPDQYEDSGDSNIDRVFGAQNKNRITALAAKALKARVLLHVASQPFISSYSMADVANAAAVVLNTVGGVEGMSAKGVTWYENRNDADILWRRDYKDLNSWETQNFPPSLFGNGETNPTQNLVDAFPMENGYPIDSPESGYNENDPYSNRDPRLDEYIVYDGSRIGSNTINTDTDSEVDGILNSEAATRTGYYLRKLLNPKVNLDPQVNSEQSHFYTYFRFTEMFLIYAEAANEAWGPEADPQGYGYTASSIIAALRNRAGISQPDEYLASCSSDGNKMRNLIRNERRIELCFEGFRFWDIRRWNMDLTETAKGMLISNGNYQVFDVENRTYDSYMVYGPIPYGETLKNLNLVQNEGW